MPRQQVFQSYFSNCNWSTQVTPAIEFNRLEHSTGYFRSSLPAAQVPRQLPTWQHVIMMTEFIYFLRMRT